jgi:beta-1,4-mannosyltransferase
VGKGGRGGHGSTTAHHQKVDLVLVQNPPAMPLLFLAAVYCRWYAQAKFVIDWHNVGYSMISLGGPVLAFAKWYECTMAPYADAHLVVTTRMQAWLHHELHLAHKPCVVVHDSPPVMFRMRTTKEQHYVLQQYLTPAIVQQTSSSSVWQSMLMMTTDQTNSTSSSSSTLFTTYDGKKKYTPRMGRPALIVTSTSYTPDEDLQILLDALVTVDEQIHSSDTTTSTTNLHIVCAITGKGPLYQHYTEQISKLKLHNILILQMWVSTYTTVMDTRCLCLACVTILFFFLHLPQCRLICLFFSDTTLAILLYRLIQPIILNSWLVQI